jgi:hypothetical protein
MFEALYVASNVRNLDMDKANAKEKSFVSSVRDEKKLWSRLCMAFEQSNHSP